MITIAERSRRCGEIAAALRGRTIRKIEVFHGDDDAGTIEIGEIALEGGGPLILARDEVEQFRVRIYRPGTGYTPENWTSWSANPPAPVPDPLAHVRAARSRFSDVDAILEGIDSDNPIYMTTRDLWRAIKADLRGAT